MLLAGCFDVAAQNGTPQSTEHGEAGSQVDVVGCLSEQSGSFKLTDEDGYIYDLEGQTAGLENHVGDELKVSGLRAHPTIPPTGHPLPETTLRVTALRTLLHVNPEGVPPVLGDLWDSYTNQNYGFEFRYPRKSEYREGEDTHPQANFVDQDKAAAVSFLGLGIQRETYPDSNFVQGSFTAIVAPGIRSEGTCAQFGSFWPEHTSSLTIHGVKYAETLSAGVGAGTTSNEYYFHTFQNGLCYELAFEFDEANGTGMPLTCSVQWVSERNEFELMNVVLSQVRFLTPEFKPRLAEPRRKNSPPTVVSFEHSAIVGDRSISFDLSWDTEGADYVQLHYECVKNLIVSGLSFGGNLECGDATDRNFPAKGTASLMLGNFNLQTVNFVVAVEPFFEGVEYRERSKAMTIAISPHPFARERMQKPEPPQHR
jgi:hypothetical protein